MNEKIGGKKGTELDDDFVLMEKVWTVPYCLVGCTNLHCRNSMCFAYGPQCSV